MNHLPQFAYKLAIASLGHIFFMFLVWIGAIYYEKNHGFLPISTEIFVSFALLWLIWPLVFMNHGKYSTPFTYKCLVVASVIHAFIVLLFWIGVIYNVYYDYLVVSSIAWATFACLWLVWPPVLAIYPCKSPIYLAGSLILSIAMLLPCATTIYTFIGWELYGFAP